MRRRRNRLSTTTDQFPDRLTGRKERNGSPRLINKGLREIDAQRVIDGRQQILISDWAILRRLTQPVRRTHNLAHIQAAAIEQCAARRPPVLSPGAALVNVDSRRPAEFADNDEQNFIAQTSLFQILDQCTDRLVELRASLSHDCKDVAMHGMVVPADHRAIVIASSVWRKTRGHHADSRFDQASSQQALLAGQMQPVPLPHFDGLTRQVEGAGRRSAGHQLEGLLTKCINRAK